MSDHDICRKNTKVSEWRRMKLLFPRLQMGVIKGVAKVTKDEVELHVRPRATTSSAFAFPIES